MISKTVAKPNRAITKSLEVSAIALNKLPSSCTTSVIYFMTSTTFILSPPFIEFSLLAFTSLQLYYITNSGDYQVLFKKN